VRGQLDTHKRRRIGRTGLVVERKVLARIWEVFQAPERFDPAVGPTADGRQRHAP
jgi:hypothetical protein